MVEAKGLTHGVERILRAWAATTARPACRSPCTPSVQPGRAAGAAGFRDEGVDLTKVVIGHAGDSNDLDYLSKFADAGCLLGMDRFGLDIFIPDVSRVDTIVALAEQGYADRMVLAHDASCYIDYFPARPRPPQQIAPNWNYTHISNDVLPMLRERGVTDDQIRRCWSTPRRYFE